MRKFAVLLGLALLVMTAQLAIADPINPFNNRPVAVAANGDNGEPSLQSMLDKVYDQSKGYVSATAGQQSAGMWALSGNSHFGAELQFENADNAPNFSIGLWTGYDTNSITKAEVFGAGTPVGYIATLKWSPDGSTLTVQVNDQDLNQINKKSYSGISKDYFGFYFGVGNQYFYTVDQLNPGGSAQVLAYQQASTDRWAFAFEDQMTGNGHIGDYQDAGFSVESITPVPEPASLALLGSGLVSLGGLLRRKRS